MGEGAATEGPRNGCREAEGTAEVGNEGGRRRGEGQACAGGRAGTARRAGPPGLELLLPQRDELGQLHPVRGRRLRREVLEDEQVVVTVVGLLARRLRRTAAVAPVVVARAPPHAVRLATRLLAGRVVLVDLAVELRNQCGPRVCQTVSIGGVVAPTPCNTHTPS